MWNIELLGAQNGLRGEARIGHIRIEISIRLVISIRLDHVDLQFSYWNFHTDGYFHTDWYIFHLVMVDLSSPVYIVNGGFKRLEMVDIIIFLLWMVDLHLWL